MKDENEKTFNDISHKENELDTNKTFYDIFLENNKENTIEFPTNNELTKNDDHPQENKQTSNPFFDNLNNNIPSEEEIIKNVLTPKPSESIFESKEIVNEEKSYINNLEIEANQFNPFFNEDSIKKEYFDIKKKG